MPLTNIVTGGAGAIGSRLVHRLVSSGAEVGVIDDLSSGFGWLLPGGVHIAKRDIGNATFEPIIKTRSRWFHLAAHFANQNSVEFPELDLRTNGLGTYRVLEACAGDGGVLVFAGAGCATGHTNTPYQIHKSLGEAYCDYFFDRAPSTKCRFHNSYGPGEVPGKYRNVIPNMMWAAMHNQTITVYGDGTDRRDFVFVEDVVNDLLAAKPSRVPFEIGSGVATSINELVGVIMDITRSKSGIVHAPRRGWDHAGRPADIDARPRKSLADGLVLTLEWFGKEYDNISRCVR